MHLWEMWLRHQHPHPGLPRWHPAVLELPSLVAELLPCEVKEQKSKQLLEVVSEAPLDMATTADRALTY